MAERQPFHDELHSEIPYNPGANPLNDMVWRDGSNVLFRGEDRVPECFNGFGGTFVNVTDTEMFIDTAQHPTIGQTFVKLTTGSAAPWRNFSLFYVGSGSLYWGSGTTTYSAQSALQVLVYTAPSTFTNLTVGLNAPSTAPQLFASATTSLKLTGTRSCVYTEYNTLTGWESNHSPVSNIVTFLNKKAVVQFNPIINVSNGANAYRIYFTPKGLGSGNAFYLYGPVILASSLGTVEGHPLSKLFDFNDNEIDFTRAAPVTFDPPPDTASHVIALETVIDLMGTYTGVGHSPSDPGSNGGSYDPLITQFNWPCERITGVWPRQGAGFSLYSTANSLQSVYGIGGTGLIALRAIWSQTGIPGGRKAGAWGGKTFYAYTNNGPARVAGDDLPPDYDFAVTVHDFMRRNFAADTVVVAYEPKDNLMLFCGQCNASAAIGGVNAGSWVAIPFRLMDEKWSPPIKLPSQPKGAVTIGNKLYLSFGGLLREWGAGSAPEGGSWALRRTGLGETAEGRRKVFRRATTAGNSAGITAKLYDNTSFTGTPKTWVSGANAFGKWAKFNFHSTNFGFEYSGTQAGQIPWGTILEGYIDPKRVR